MLTVGSAQPVIAAAKSCGKPLSVASSSVGRSMVFGKDGLMSGTIKDFLNRISLDSSCTFEFRQVPRARAWMLLSVRDIDLVPAAVQTADRDRMARFVPTHRVTPQLLTLNAPLSAVHDGRELVSAGLRVGVVRGYQYGEHYQQLKGQLAQQGLLDEVADPETIVKMLKAGRIKATILPLTALADAAENLGVGKDVRAVSLTELPVVQVGIYFSRATVTTEDFTIIERSIRRLIQCGAYEQDMRRHYPAWALKGVQRG